MVDVYPVLLRDSRAVLGGRSLVGRIDHRLNQRPEAQTNPGVGGPHDVEMRSVSEQRARSRPTSCSTCWRAHLQGRVACRVHSPALRGDEQETRWTAYLVTDGDLEPRVAYIGDVS